MFGFAPKLPVTEEERQWVDEGFKRLEKMLGRRRMLEARIITPCAEDFPDAFDQTPAAAEKLFCRLCTYMSVDRRSVEFEIFPDETEELRNILPEWRGGSGGCAAGLYFHDNAVVAVKSSELNDPMMLVATMAHELGHVILIGGKLMQHTTSDHEPMTDLLTVYLGLGIFTANSAARFKQYQDERRFGWSMKRLGYLAEEIYGYALAKFIVERGEDKPEWIQHLSTNVGVYCKRSLRWLARNPQYVPVAKSIG